MPVSLLEYDYGDDGEVRRCKLKRRQARWHTFGIAVIYDRNYPVVITSATRLHEQRQINEGNAA